MSPEHYEAGLTSDYADELDAPDVDDQPHAHAQSYCVLGDCGSQDCARCMGTANALAAEAEVHEPSPDPIGTIAVLADITRRFEPKRRPHEVRGSAASNACFGSP